MNPDDNIEKLTRELIEGSRIEIPEGMSDRVMFRITHASPPVARHSFIKVWIFSITSLLLMPMAIFLFKKNFDLFENTLGKAGRYFVFLYEYMLIAIFLGLALFLIDFILRNTFEKNPRLI